MFTSRASLSRLAISFLFTALVDSEGNALPQCESTGPLVLEPVEQPRVPLLAGPRTRIALNGVWQRVISADDSAIPQSGWHNVRVPEAHHDAGEGAAWFQLDFNIPAELIGPGRRVALRFVRVRHYARVFVNGQYVGENYGSRAPFEVDITPAAVPGALNRLNVWVHHCGGDWAAPGISGLSEAEESRLTTMMGYRYQATIAEDVFLLSRPALRVSDVALFPSVRRQELTVRLTLVNEGPTQRAVSIANNAWLADELALAMPEQSGVVVAPGGTAQVEVAAAWPDPQLWYPAGLGEPTLYHLETVLLDEAGAAIDRWVSRFGFREIWTDGTEILLNGDPLRLFGYWQPEGSGRSIWTLRMASVQAAGANVIHNHAEQREPSFYDVADEMGLLVWDANYCGGPSGTTPFDEVDTVSSFPTVEAELARQYPEWVRSVQSHPSVVVMMSACLIHNEATIALADVIAAADHSRLLVGNGVRAYEPLSFGTFLTNIDMHLDAPLTKIRRDYLFNGIAARFRPGGGIVPAGVSECWHDAPEQTSDIELAVVTFRTMNFYGDHNVVTVNLFNQRAYVPQRAVASVVWPSDSGLGQHPQQATTGGSPWPANDYVNFFDPGRPAFTPTIVRGAMRSAGSRYLGYVPTVSSTYRPEVLITVTRGGSPVADAYVLARPVEGVIGTVEGMRTDGRGVAWFQLRDAGVYEFSCTVDGNSQSVVIDAPVQELDLSSGGVRPQIHASLTIP